MNEQQACTLCGAGGHTAAQCNWRTDAALDKIRAAGLTIDGDNAYKRDLLDAAIGALAFGKQGSTPPPDGHWGWRFYEIGKAEAAERDRDVRIMQAMALDLGRVGEALGIPGMEQEGGADELIYIIEEMKAAHGAAMPQAWLDVQAERRRQIEEEGWTPEHDDEHDDGKIAEEAASFLMNGQSPQRSAWSWKHKHPDSPTRASRRRQLVIGVALGLAEIERLDRAAALAQGGE